VSITVNTKAYAFRSNSGTNIANYDGPNKTFALKDDLLLASTPAKPGSSPGVARSRAKFTRTVEYATGLYHDAICEVTVSFPVGMAEAAIDSLRDDMGDFLISSNGDDLFFKHDINQ
jgi:hypothetical protein